MSIQMKKNQQLLLAPAGMLCSVGAAWVLWVPSNMINLHIEVMTLPCELCCIGLD